MIVAADIVESCLASEVLYQNVQSLKNLQKAQVLKKNSCSESCNPFIRARMQWPVWLSLLACFATSPLLLAGFSKNAVKWRMRLFSRKNSKILGSFWSPQIISSDIARKASTTLPLFWSVTVEFVRKTSWRCCNSSKEYFSRGAWYPSKLLQNPPPWPFPAISARKTHDKYGKDGWIASLRLNKYFTDCRNAFYSSPSTVKTELLTVVFVLGTWSRMRSVHLTEANRSDPGVWGIRLLASAECRN